MKELHITSFWESLMIQKRVIGALIIRETITRYGRSNIGFLWLFVEPLLVTFIIVLIWKFLRAGQVSGFNVVSFVITGYPMVMMWRNVTGRAVGSIDANTSLLYHRNVRVLDTIFARMFLEIAGATVAQIAITAILFLIGWIEQPSDIFYMLIAWMLMAWFAMGLGLVICSIAFKYEAFGKIWSTITFVSLPLSGVFFFVHALPVVMQEYLLWIPMIHGTEMFRGGYFGSSVITMENPWFLVLCNMILTFFGLAMVADFSKGVEPQ